jgi:hypothetical protein
MDNDDTFPHGLGMKLIFLTVAPEVCDCKELYLLFLNFYRMGTGD